MSSVSSYISIPQGWGQMISEMAVLQLQAQAGGGENFGISLQGAIGKEFLHIQEWWIGISCCKL